MKDLSRRDKYLPADGSIPKRAKYTCSTCKAWVASTTGQVGHERRFPGHVLINVSTGQPVHHHKGPGHWTQTPAGRKHMAALASRPRTHLLGITPQNGHSSEISPALLEYAFSKMRSTIESELDRLHDQLIPSPEPATRRSKIYVAR